MKKENNLTPEAEEIQAQSVSEEVVSEGGTKKKGKREAAFLWTVGICVTVFVAVVSIFLFADPVAAMKQKKQALAVLSEEEIRITVSDPKIHGVTFKAAQDFSSGEQFIDSVNGNIQFIVPAEGAQTGDNTMIYSGSMVNGILKDYVASGDLLETLNSAAMLNDEQANAIRGELSWVLDVCRFNDRSESKTEIWMPSVIVYGREDRAVIYLGEGAIVLQKDGVCCSYTIREKDHARYDALCDTVLGYVEAAKDGQ